jgi:phosphoesterase RecJ-like protein
VTDLDRVVAALRGARRLAAVCHENPDADTIGAAVAVSLIAERLGTEHEIVSCDGIPAAFDYLPNVARVRRRSELRPDVVVVCDAATRERIGPVAGEPAGWLDEAVVVNVDHHLSSSHFGHVNLVDPAAAATCEVLVRVVDALGLEIDAQLATALLTGIIRDSQGLSSDATSPETLRVTARLVEAGAPLGDIHRAVLSELPLPTVKLWGRLLAAAQPAMEGRVVYTILEPPMLAETGTRQHDADGAVEFLSNSEGVDITILFRDLAPSEVRVSIRTSARVNAIAVAEQFGGGGHARRAGAMLAEPMSSAIERVLAACEAVLG